MNNEFISMLSSLYGSIPQNNEIPPNKFTRWGKNKRYWIIPVGMGYAYGDLVTDTKSSWFPPNDSVMSQLDLEARNQRIRELFSKATENRSNEYLQISEQVQAEYNSYSEDCSRSFYLSRKQIHSYGVKYHDNKLIIPAFDITGKIWTYQKISNDGTKLFRKGGKKSGCFYPIGSIVNSNIVFICEGFATAASVYTATGITSIVAFDAGNIDCVVAILKTTYPHLKILIAGDNDQWKEQNTGKITAEKAALKHGIQYILPLFSPNLSGHKPTDFNDLFVLQGIDEVSRQLSCIISSVTPVTDVQTSNSANYNVTPDVPNTDQGVTAPALSLIPTTGECPCYRVFDNFYKEGKINLKAGVWYFYMKRGKNEEPDTLAFKWICSPLHIEAVTFDKQENNFGRLLRFKTSNGKWRVWPMPMELLKGFGDELRGELLSMGVEIDPSARTQFLQYLQYQIPKRKVLCTLQVGWCENSFVLPDAVIGNRSSDIIFQTGERYDNEYVTKGTLVGWQQEIAAYAIKNSLLAVTLSSAFAGVLLERCNFESGGFHYVGDSSSGKTCLIEAACSVWGGDNYKRSWRATANGMEGVAAMFNDTLLALDEISECDPREVGSIVYSLGNGRGKQRASRTGSARGVKRWRCIVLSSGERSIETTMAEGGHRIKAGQNTRLPSIPIARRFGVWDDLCGIENGAALTDAIKSSSKRHCGHAGRQFLEHFTRDNRDMCAYLENMKAYAFTVSGSEGQTKRVAAKFALIAIAGELATEYGITGWPPGTAINAAVATLQYWLKTCTSVSNSENQQIIKAVAAFIERHGDSRFSNANNDNEIHTRDRAGWWSDYGGQRTYLFTADGMREALKGFDFKRALDELQKSGVLPPSEKNGERSKGQRFGGRLVKVYHINAEKLGEHHEY